MLEERTVTLFGAAHLLFGEAAGRHIHDDTDLADIDRLSMRYNGVPYPVRDAPRVSAWMRPRRTR